MRRTRVLGVLIGLVGGAGEHALRLLILGVLG